MWDLPKKAILNDELICLLAEHTLSRIVCVDVEGLHKGLRKNAGRTHEMSGETVFQPNGRWCAGGKGRIERLLSF